jgi:hypothetical protein
MRKTTPNNNIQPHTHQHRPITPTTGEGKTADQPAHHINHPTSTTKQQEISVRTQHEEKPKEKKLTLRPLKHYQPKPFKPN